MAQPNTLQSARGEGEAIAQASSLRVRCHLGCDTNDVSRHSQCSCFCSISLAKVGETLCPGLGKKGGTVTEALEKSKRAQRGRAIVEAGKENKRRREKKRKTAATMSTIASVTHHPRLGLRSAASIFAENCIFETGVELKNEWQTRGGHQQSAQGTKINQKIVAGDKKKSIGEAPSSSQQKKGENIATSKEPPTHTHNANTPNRKQTRKQTENKQRQSPPPRPCSWHDRTRSPPNCNNKTQ